MDSFQKFEKAVGEVTKLAESLAADAAAGLINQAELLALEQQVHGFNAALRALQGEKELTSAAVTTAQKTSLEIGEEIVRSYRFDRETGVSRFTVPAGFTDVEAMTALNDYFRMNLPSFKRDAVYAGNLDWYAGLPSNYPAYCQERDYSQARNVVITGVVKGTQGGDLTTQGDNHRAQALRGQALTFSDTRDQALAAALHACKHKGEDLFQDLWVCGSVPGFALKNDQHLGVVVHALRGVYDHGRIAASGSPLSRAQNNLSVDN
ncbi:MAG: hypothetical protein ACK5Y6_01605 [Pseudomonadota bacterium]